MLHFILTNLLMLSLGAMLYLVVRTLPRVQEEEPKLGFMERWIASEVPEKLDNVTQRFLSKFFRKMKVYILKLDNTVSNRLNSLKKQKKEPQETLPFATDTESKEGGDDQDQEN